ncbi:MAG: LEA type 2 family protein [Ferruginibacter sp.]|jgi:LEA14-like dessication related protein
MIFSKHLPTLSIFILLTNLLVSCSTPKELEYRNFNNLQVEKVGFAATSLKMDLVYYNPNNFGMELNRTDLDIYINNNYLGRTAQEYQISIPKRAEFAIPIKIDVDMKNLLKNGLTTFLTNEVMVKVTGTIRVGKLNVFKTFNVNYEGKQQFSF